jgi:hypothetical protein
MIYPNNHISMACSVVTPRYNLYIKFPDESKLHATSLRSNASRATLNSLQALTKAGRRGVGSCQVFFFVWIEALEKNCLHVR